MPIKKQRLSESATDFLAFYGRRPSDSELAVEREVFGVNAGIISYTTPDQAAALIPLLNLERGMGLLEIGAGAGWPGVYIAERTAGRAVLTDLPVSAVRIAARRAAKRGVDDRVFCAAASATHLPFRAASFEAVVHCDVL